MNGLKPNELTTLNAITGSKFILRYFQHKIQASDVMIVILTYLEPDEFMKYDHFSKRFYHEYLPSVVENRRKIRTAVILGEIQKTLL